MKTNRFAGKCSTCGHIVAADAGLLSGRPGAWVTTHKAGECVTTPAPAPVEDPTPGAYITTTGEMVRVVLGRQSRRIYVMTWTGVGKTGEWTYAGRGPLASIVRPVTADEAAAHGHLTERCCFCGIKLRTPESVAVGYGPDCAEQRGLPWGTKRQTVKVTADPLSGFTGAA